MSRISKYLNYLIIIAILVMAGVFFFQKKGARPVERQSASVPKPSVNVDEVVNKYMKQTAEQAIRDQVASFKAEREQMNKPVEIKKALPEIKPEDIPREQQIHKDAKLEQSPSDLIQNERFQKEAQQKQDELDKKEYARQFIENARKQGYHLELSPDLEVIKVTPIRQPSQSDEYDSYPAD